MSRRSPLRVVLVVFGAIYIATGCKPTEPVPDDQSRDGGQPEEVVSGDQTKDGDSTSEKTEPTNEGDTSMTPTIQTDAFSNNEPIPARYTGDGQDISPALSFSNVPEGAAELALIMDDPDAPTPSPWVHWVIYKIPVSATGLEEGVATSAAPPQVSGALQGTNSWGRLGYGGPAPPAGSGAHHYYFKLYALDTTLSVASGLEKDALLAAMEGHVIAQAELVGTYQR
ncbi:MAG: YbhB/YbcL family Raf kinase inhibitor-like protein [Phycisphaerales bacterium]|nr:MAG: YbhB/YbcL family Raf kinase inhibitor-like protein [Phycisphaerales bacterium]